MNTELGMALQLITEFKRIYLLIRSDKTTQILVYLLMQFVLVVWASDRVVLGESFHKHPYLQPEKGKTYSLV